MANLEYLDQVLTQHDDGTFHSVFLVPMKLNPGDYLPPFQFEVFNKTKKFYFFGRYNAEADTVEFVLAGEPGCGYKVSFSDGNSPYGWKVKRHGMTRTEPSTLGEMDRLFRSAVSSFFDFSNQDTDLDEFKERVTDMAFEEESIIAVSHETMRLSQGNGRVNAKELGGPWRFYGPSFPEDYCACKVKVIVYSDDDPHMVSAATSTTQSNRRESDGGEGTDATLAVSNPDE